MWLAECTLRNLYYVSWSCVKCVHIERALVKGDASEAKYSQCSKCEEGMYCEDWGNNMYSCIVFYNVHECTTYFSGLYVLLSSNILAKWTLYLLISLAGCTPITSQYWLKSTSYCSGEVLLQVLPTASSDHDLKCLSSSNCEYNFSAMIKSAQWMEHSSGFQNWAHQSVNSKCSYTCHVSLN